MGLPAPQTLYTLYSSKWLDASEIFHAIFLRELNFCGADGGLEVPALNHDYKQVVGE